MSLEELWKPREVGGVLARVLFEKDLGCWERGGRESSPGSLPNRVLSSSRLQFLFPYQHRCPVAGRGGGVPQMKPGRRGWVRLLKLRGRSQPLEPNLCLPMEIHVWFYLQSCVSQWGDFVPRGTQATRKRPPGVVCIHPRPRPACAHTFVGIPQSWCKQ